MRFVHISACLLILINVNEIHFVKSLGFSRRLKGLNEHLEAYYKNQRPNEADELEARLMWFQQKLDHFDNGNKEIWQQRYLAKTKYHEDGGPVFLFISGESVINTRWLKIGHMAELAKKYGAAMFNLEHRFYGGSKPTIDLKVESLKYLTSEQALADLAYFITKMNQEYNFSNLKWFVFGGSYAGSLAAWLRYKYPHLVYAAVSSSGPLLAEADFPEYFETVTNSLATATPKCVDAIRTANQKMIDGVTKSEKRKHYAELFELCEPFDENEKDITTFFEVLADNFAAIVQYNRVRLNTETDTVIFDIDAVCSIMTDENIKCPVHRYAEINKLALTIHEEKCLDHKYSKNILRLRDTSYGLETDMWRQWLWQSCTEFGFFQTSSNASAPFGDKLTLNYFVDWCTDIFGPSFNETFLTQAVEETNMKYGAHSLPVSRVIFIHGSIDPWSPLGITQTPPAGSYALFIKGTAHCKDMMPETRDDPPQLLAARNKISEIIENWLNGKNTGTKKQSVFYFES